MISPEHETSYADSLRGVGDDAERLRYRTQGPRADTGRQLLGLCRTPAEKVRLREGMTERLHE